MEQMHGSTWKQTFRVHVLILERFLIEAGVRSISGEQAVYLAGMIARRMDRNYQSQISDLLLEDPEQLDQLMRSHAPYIGQNAPILTLSRINGEFLTASRALEGKDIPQFRKAIAQRYFAIADFYARQVGNRSIADIMAFLRREFPRILELLTQYRRFFAEQELPPRVTKALWKKLAQEFNERNRKKERWERMGVDPSKKVHLSRPAFNAMLNFESTN